MLPQNFFIFILFYDFYRKAYNKQPKVAESGARLELNNNAEKEVHLKKSDCLKPEIGQSTKGQKAPNKNKIEWS